MATRGFTGGGFNVKPHTARASKLWTKSHRIPKPQAPVSFVRYSESFDFRDPVSGLAFLQFLLVSDFVSALPLAAYHLFL
jgi:hypothetical protein